MKKHHRRRILGILRGIEAMLLLSLTTAVSVLCLLVIGILKLFPHKRWQARCTHILDDITMLWCETNNKYIKSTNPTQWDITGIDHLQRNQWYLVVANHQSWLDIVVLHYLFTRKIPVLKFFIKDQLKWLPLLGFAWWAMGFPFLKRYSKEYLAKNPHKQGADLIATQKAVAKFAQYPSSIMSFVEGTRYTAHKKKLQQSPYSHLLRPKAGGISQVVSMMGEKLTGLIDVSIVYSNNKSLWDFLCHRVKAIKVHVRHIPIPSQFHNPAVSNNPETQAQFREWLNQHWHEKDAILSTMHADSYSA